MTHQVLTWQVNSLETAYIIGSQLIDGSHTGSRQHLLQKVSGPQSPDQSGELALGRWRTDVAVHRAQHRWVCGGRATGSIVNIVQLQRQPQRETKEVSVSLSGIMTFILKIHYLTVVLGTGVWAANEAREKPLRIRFQIWRRFWVMLKFEILVKIFKRGQKIMIFLQKKIIMAPFPITFVKTK